MCASRICEVGPDRGHYGRQPRHRQHHRITRAVVDQAKSLGLKPFIVPAMGSHGGATAEGQSKVLGHYGVTESTTGCPVRSSMEVVEVGKTKGTTVYCDKNAWGADHIAVVGRVNAHPDFSGEIESGLFKMMAIGLGEAARGGELPSSRATLQLCRDLPAGGENRPGHRPYSLWVGHCPERLWRNSRGEGPAPEGLRIWGEGPVERRQSLDGRITLRSDRSPHRGRDGEEY